MEEQKSMNRSVLIIVFLCIAAFAFVLVYVIQADRGMNQGSNMDAGNIASEPTIEQEEAKATPAVVDVTPKDEMKKRVVKDELDLVVEDIDDFSEIEMSLTGSEDDEVNNAGTVNTSGYLETYDETKY